MNYETKIMEVIAENNGYIKSSEIKKMGIPTIYLTRLVNKMEIIKVTRGIYILPNIFEDEFYINQIKYSHIIYARTTALYLNGLSNKTLKHIEVNVPKEYNNQNLAFFNIYRVNKVLYETGIAYVRTPYGNEVKSYDMERCICDLFLFNQHDSEQVKFAINEFLKQTSNFEKLYNYAKKLGVYTEIFTLFEVLQ